MGKVHCHMTDCKLLTSGVLSFNPDRGHAQRSVLAFRQDHQRLRCLQSKCDKKENFFNCLILPV